MAIEINKPRLLKLLWETGQFWNPSKPDVLNITQDDLPTLEIEHPVVSQAVASWQAIDKTFDTLAFIVHLRSIIADGEIGPVTNVMLDVPRCPIPDYPPPPNARFHYDNPDLQRAVESMQANAMGSGSWPSCDPERQGVNSLRVRIDTTRASQIVRGYLDKSLAAVVGAYAEMGAALRYILSPSGDCEIAKRFESLAGSVIGWNEFPDPNTCNQTISGRLDTGYAPSDYRYFANLECHETGHGVGLNHTRGSIMNPSILLVWPLTWKGSPSETALRRYFGGEPLTPPTPPPPLPDQPNGVFVYNDPLVNKARLFELRIREKV